MKKTYSATIYISGKPTADFEQSTAVQIGDFDTKKKAEAACRKILQCRAPAVGFRLIRRP